MALMPRPAIGREPRPSCGKGFLGGYSGIPYPFECQQAGNIPAGGRMYYPRKRSGSMPAGQARPLRTRGGIVLVPRMPTGTMAVMLTRRRMWASTVPTPGAFLICMAMCGSGTRMVCSYDSDAQTDPEGPATGFRTCLRGGSWYNRFWTHAFGRPLQLPSYRTTSIGFRLGFQQVNQAPTDLNSTAALSISENQPVGTIVGEFNATDRIAVVRSPTTS